MLPLNYTAVHASLLVKIILMYVIPFKNIKILYSSIFATGTFACSFPARWAGNWFQSGVHHLITITSSSISTKGKCLEVDGEKYLVYQP